MWCWFVMRVCVVWVAQAWNAEPAKKNISDTAQCYCSAAFHAQNRLQLGSMHAFCSGGGGFVLSY